MHIVRLGCWLAAALQRHSINAAQLAVGQSVRVQQGALYFGGGNAGSVRIGELYQLTLSEAVDQVLLRGVLHGYACVCLTIWHSINCPAPLAALNARPQWSARLPTAPRPVPSVAALMYAPKVTGSDTSSR